MFCSILQMSQYSRYNESCYVEFNPNAIEVFVDAKIAVLGEANARTCFDQLSLVT